MRGAWLVESGSGAAGSTRQVWARRVMPRAQADLMLVFFGRRCLVSCRSTWCRLRWSSLIGCR